MRCGRDLRIKSSAGSFSGVLWIGSAGGDSGPVSLCGSWAVLGGLVVDFYSNKCSKWGGALSAKTFALGLFCLSLLIRLGAVTLLSTPIESDFLLQYEASRQFAQGDFSFQESTYFQRWGYQTGLVVWQGTLLRLWDDPLLLRLVNCLASAGTNLLVYLIARERFWEEGARMAGLAYAFFLFPATLVTVLCNNIPSGFFLYLALYLVMGRAFPKRRLGAYALAGVSLALANALRPDAPLVLVPLLAYFVFQFASEASLSHLLRCGRRFLPLFLTFWAVGAALSALVQATGVNGAGLGNHDPLWGLVLGTNTESGGVYNDGDILRIATLREEGLTRTQAELQVIGEHLGVSGARILETAISKMDTLWWDRALDWSLGYLRKDTPGLFAWLEEVDGAMFAWALILAGIGVLGLFRRPGRDPKAYLPLFIVFAVCCVYLAIEVQPRYAYVGQVAVFILLAGARPVAGLDKPPSCLRQGRSRPTQIYGG